MSVTIEEDTITVNVDSDEITVAITEGDVISNTSVSVDGEVALFSGTSGKSLKRATGSGIVKATSGVFGLAVADTDYLLPATAASLYAPIANGVTNGNSHDHNGGDGAQISHLNLSNIGTNTHAQIDTHIAGVNPHSGSQPLDATLTSLALLGTSADKMLYTTGVDTWAELTVTAANRSGLSNLSGTNTGDQTITLTGDVTGSGTGSFAATIANGAVSLAKMADMATASLLGRNTAGSGIPEALSASTVRSLLGLVIGTDVQAYDADLTTWAGITPAANIAAFLATPTSANLAAAVTDETGSGALVFANTPTLITPVLGAATGASLQLSGLTASQILATDASKNLVSLDVAVYPSLTELIYLKGVTSALQTQLNAKQSTLTNSAGLAAALTDETGSGLAVFNNAPAITNPVITNIAPAADFTITQNSVVPFTSVNTGAVANTLYLKAGNVGIGTTVPGSTRLRVVSASGEVFKVDDGANAYIRTTIGTGTVFETGNVGIGMTNPGMQFEISSDNARKASTATWATVCDMRLKQDIEIANLDRCYEIIKSLPLKRFRWKDNVFSAEQVKDRAKLGWIAQDVKPFFSKAVNQSKRELLTGVNEIIEEDEQETIEQEIIDTGVEVVEMDGKFIQKTITKTRIEKVPQYDEIQLYDEAGNVVIDDTGAPVIHKKPKMKKVQKTIIKYDSIEDCYDMNVDQIYAAMYGTVQKLIHKVEALEAKIK